MSNNDWYRYAVPRQLVGLNRERIAADRAAAERDIDFVLAQTGLSPADRILEIGCGWGRHALDLAGRGFEAVASIDIAPEPLRIARAMAAEAGLNCDFRQQDFMEVAEEPFAAVLSLYDRSCCGFPSEAADERSLRHLAGMVAPGGWLIFGINDWPFVLPSASQRWNEIPAGIELIEIIADRAAMTCTDRVTLLRPDGTRERHDLTRRHYYLPEVRRLLAAAGFALESAWSRLDAARPYGDGSDGLFVVARRAGLGV